MDYLTSETGGEEHDIPIYSCGSIEVGRAETRCPDGMVHERIIVVAEIEGHDAPVSFVLPASAAMDAGDLMFKLGSASRAFNLTEHLWPDGHYSRGHQHDPQIHVGNFNNA